MMNFRDFTTWINFYLPVVNLCEPTDNVSQHYFLDTDFQEDANL